MTFMTTLQAIHHTEQMDARRADFLKHWKRICAEITAENPAVSEAALKTMRDMAWRAWIAGNDQALPQGGAKETHE